MRRLFAEGPVARFDLFKEFWLSNVVDHPEYSESYIDLFKLVNFMIYMIAYIIIPSVWGNEGII